MLRHILIGLLALPAAAWAECIDLTGQYHCQDPEGRDQDLAVEFVQQADGVVVNTLDGAGATVESRKIWTDGVFRPYTKGVRAAATCDAKRLRRVLVSSKRTVEPSDPPVNAIILDYSRGAGGDLVMVYSKGRVRMGALEVVGADRERTRTCRRR